MFKKSMRIIAMILVISLTAALVPTAVFADVVTSAAENEAVFDGEKNSATGVREGQSRMRNFRPRLCLRKSRNPNPNR